MANGLDQLRQFIYDNYEKSHGIFSDETESAWESRFQGHISVLRLTLPSNRTARNLGLLLWQRVVAGSGAKALVS
jgi:hypothetical protein